MPQYLERPLRECEEISRPNHERPPVEPNPKRVDEPLQGHHAAETDVGGDLLFLAPAFPPWLFARVPASLPGREPHVGPPLLTATTGVVPLPLVGSVPPVPRVFLFLLALKVGVL